MKSSNLPLIVSFGLILQFLTSVGAKELNNLEGRAEGLFKGEEIPDVNWMSNDITNFTWGLTGVDNFENLMFSTYLFSTLGISLALLFLFRIYIHSVQHSRLAITVSSSYTAASSHFYSLPPGKKFAWIRRHLILAPLHKLRHNNPWMVNCGSKIRLHLGTLPSRIHFIYLFLYILSNVLYCTLALPWNGSIGPEGKFRAPTKASLVAEFRGRTGVMATVNMIPLFVCMVRNNWIGDAVQVNFDTWNLFHRWIGRIVALESFAHMGAWTVNKIDQSGWSGVGEAYKISPFLQVGLMAEIALALIAVASASPLRHANYEFFLSLHQILVIFFMVGVYWHLVIDQLPQITYANITIAIWVLDRVMRIFWILRWNVKMKGGKVSCNVAEVIPLKGANAVRVSVELVRPWDFKPGQHAYIYIPRIGWWQSHPFSIAWASTEQEFTESEDTSWVEHGNAEDLRRSQIFAAETGEKVDPMVSVREHDAQHLSTPRYGGGNPYEISPHHLSPEGHQQNNRNSTYSPRPASRLHRLSMPPLPVYHRELVTTQAPKTKTTMHFVISKHSGFTKKLYDAAAKANNGNDGEKGEVAPLQVVGMFEGPYGGHHSFDSYGTTIFVAGGVGITHGIGYVKHLLHGYNKGTAATQRIKLVWVVRSVDNIEWVADWLEGILQMPNVRQVVEVDVYITQPNEAAHTSSWSGRGGVVKLYTGRPDFDIIVEKAVKRQVGAMAVNVCGGGAVSDAVRAAARKYVDVSSIDFSEESFSW